MRSSLSRLALACAFVAAGGANLVGQTFDDPASALGAPQVDGVYAFNSAGYSIAGPTMTCSASSADVNDVWLAYIAVASGVVQFTVCPSSPVTGGSISPSDSAMALWDTSGPGAAPGVQLDCQDGGGSCGVGQSVINFNVTAGVTYYVQLQNWGSISVISGNLAIGMPPPPGPGDDCSLAYPQVGPGAVALVATTSSSGGTSNCAGGPDGGDQWIAYTATLTGLCYASTCPTSVNAPGGNNFGIATYVAAYTACPAGAFTDIACDAGGSSPCGFGAGGEIAFPITAGVTYYIQVGDWNTFGSVAGVTVAFAEAIPPASVFTDDCSTAPFVIEGVHGYSSLGNSIPGPVAGCSASVPDPNDCWVTYSPTQSGVATFSNCPSSVLAPGGSTVLGTDTFIAVWDASTCPPTVELGCADGSPCGVAQSEVSISVCAGSLYYVQVGQWGNPGTVSGAVAIAVSGIGGGAGPGDEPLLAVGAAAPGVTPYNSTGFTAAGPASNCTGFGGADVFDFWMTFVSPVTGTAIASNCPSSALAPGGSASPTDSYISAYGSTPCGLPGAALGCGGFGTPQCGNEAEVQFQVTAGNTYFVQVGTWSNSQASSGAIAIAFVLPPSNDECATAIPLTFGANGPFNNIGATASSPQGSCGLGADNDVWFSFFATCSGNLQVDTCGTGFDTWLSVWDNCPAASGVEVVCNDQAAGGPCSAVFGPSYVSIPIISGTTYYINVAGWGNQTGAFNVNVRCSYIHQWSVPSGPGSIKLENVDGPPNALALSAVTLDIVHPGLPGAVTFPNGWFYGVPMGFFELVQQINWPGGVPFGGFLDGSGYMLNASLPAGTTTGLAGATIWSVGVAFDPLTGFATVADTTAPTAFAL